MKYFIDLIAKGVEFYRCWKYKFTNQKEKQKIFKKNEKVVAVESH